MAAIDRFANVDSYPGGTLAPLMGPAVGGEAVTPHNTNELTYVTRALYVGGAGNVVLRTHDGSTLTLVGVPAGTLLPLRVKGVNATSTTATFIVALW